MEKYKVTFLPENKTVEVDKDRTILSAAISAGIFINSACGGDGVCGRCKVIVKSGRVLSQSSSAADLELRKKGIYLACLTTIHSDLEVEVPAESRIEQHKVSAPGEQVDFYEPDGIVKFFRHLPLSWKLYLELPPPTKDDNISDLGRLVREIQKSKDIVVEQASLMTVRSLGALLRDADWKVTVTLGYRAGIHEIIQVEAGDTSGRNYGIALDIGTTTVSAQLIHCRTKVPLATRATANKQAMFGADVITRIVHAQKPDGLAQLSRAVCDCINTLILELAQEQNVDMNDITVCSCTGNTTMIHLLLSVDPATIRREPYVPALCSVPVIRAWEAGIKINPHGLLYIIPGISSYVGGDLTAGLVCCGLDKTDDLSLLIDIGTNGEICLGNREFLIATAASAGPAFEGSGISCGMRSSPGAVEKVKINPKDFSLVCQTIEGARPKGICGSGYINLLAEMLRAGLLDKNGKIKSIAAKRMRQTPSGMEFIVVFKEESATGEHIIINDADIENLKRSKAAIYAACSMLVRHMSFDLKAVKRYYISGGFGTSLDIENAIAIGLLPDVERTRFLFVGNSALAGSRQVLLSSDALSKSHEIASKMAYYELSGNNAYMEEYTAAMFFPHTDAARFPSVKK